MRRMLLAVGIGAVSVLVGAGPALACGGLIGRNGSVNLVKTTTLAAWHDGIEHYVTSFKFAGSGGQFGSIIPLPAVPTSVERGGDWTLQRLVREVQPPLPLFAAGKGEALAAAAPAPPDVLLQTRVDALDITVLRGGGASVGQWATDNGFLLTPDTPAVLDFYASRSPIFLAAKFDAAAALQKGVAIGDGTPVDITMPTSNPWVPLRILGVGHQPTERISADVFLLTDQRPALLPGTGAAGLTLSQQAPASASLMTDLRADKGMDWLPSSMWLSYLKVDATPGQLTYDLAVDATGAGHPSPVAAGLKAASSPEPTSLGVPAGTSSGSRSSVPGLVVAAAAAGAGAVVLGLALVAVRRRSVAAL